MRKIFKAAAVATLALGCVAGAASCGGEKYELAVVTDVGQLKDGGFNQGTYEGVENYAKANGKSYNYYAPANGADATDADRIAAMELAIKNGAKVIVTPGFLQAAAITDVATKNPDVKFVFVDGWAMGLDNVTAIVYKEQESGYLAGYAAVKEGYTQLGGVFGGGGSNPACNRFAYGYVQGAKAAAIEDSKTVSIKVSYKYGDAFSASTELESQASGWYQAGTEVIFSCGGSMVSSVVSAAKAYPNAKIIGVDVDQAGLSTQVLTSAVKGLTPSVEKVLGQYYANKWDTELKNVAQNLGAAENATGLPTTTDSFRFKNFTAAQYNEVFNKIKNGTITPRSDVLEDCNVETFWSALSAGTVTVALEK